MTPNLHHLLRRTAIVLLALPCLATYAQRREAHEFYKDIPVYVDSIQQSLTYPMARRNNPGTDFATWKAQARATVWQAMGPLPPATPDFDMQVEAREQREGYEALRISVQLTRW